MDIPISRREFLKTSGIVAGSLTAGGSFTGCALTSSPVLDATEPDPISYPKLSGYKIQPPEDRCYTGIWMGSAVDIKIKTFQELVGKKPTFIFTPYLFDTCIDYGFYGDKEMEFAAKLGVIPFVSLDARDLMDPYRSILKDIANGKYDKTLINAAQKVKSFGDKMLKEGQCPGFFIRTMREMNVIGGAWSWSWHRSDFINAWIYIWNIFENKGANEYATWVFNPYVGQRRHGIGLDFYPGDEYVDWIGFNGYNWDGQASWASRSSIVYLFRYPSNFYLNKHPDKPQLICETGMDKLGYKPKWIIDGLNSMQSKLPGIKGVAFWSEHWSHGRIRNFDSRINSSPEALAALKDGFSNPYFIGAIGDRI